MRKNNALQAVFTDNKDRVLDTRLERETWPPQCTYIASGIVKVFECHGNHVMFGC